MARTLADLTSKLSRDLKAIEARCAKQMEKIERERDEALIESRSARGALSRYNRGLARAKAAQLSLVQKANELRDKEIRAAEEERGRQVALEEHRYRKAANRAHREREVAIRKARAKWKALLGEIRARPLPEQRALRKVAERAHEEVVEAAREACQDAIDKARVAHLSRLQEVLGAERLAFESANRTAERMITSAAVGYERAVAQEEARMRGSLVKDVETRRILERSDRRVSASRQLCEREKEALFRRFTEERKKLEF